MRDKIKRIWYVWTERICPVCNSDLVDVGFSGWKKKCPQCDYNNYEHSILSDEFLEDKS